MPDQASPDLVLRADPAPTANGPTTFAELLQARSSDGSAHVAIATAKGGMVTATLSPDALMHAVDAAAGRLAKLGLQRGDAIAIWLPNIPEWLIVHLAAARIGVRTVPINTWSRSSEVTHLLRIQPCRAVVVAPGYRAIAFERMLDEVAAALLEMGALPPEWVITVGAGGDAPRGRGTMDLADLPSGPLSPSLYDGAVIGFPTSGTTSMPKLALHGERSLVAHACAVVARAEMSGGDVVLCALPPCGAYGYGMILAALASGATAILCEEFEINAALTLIASERVTMLALTEPLIRQLLDHRRADRTAFESLRLVFSAGGSLEPLVRRAEQDFLFRISNVYGSSEVLALAAFWEPAADVATRAAAGGRLTNPDMRVRAGDAGGGQPGIGKPGELQFRGATVTSGYVGMADASQATFTADGWFRSGDLGVVLNTEGTRFHYIARLNDALRLKGFLVNPGEIEAMLQTHPQVAAAQVIGVPDPNGEDSAVGFVVAREGAVPDPVELAAYCRARMASYKVPRRIGVLDAFPLTRSANGDKVVKHQLRTLAKEMLAHG